MKITRRKVVASAGVGALSLGAIFGTGAFSSVEAQRGVRLDLSDDAAALLALEPNVATGLGSIIGISAVDGSPLEAYKGDTSQYLDDSGNTLAIDMSDSNINQASGLNDEAITSFRDIVRMTNNGTQEVGINVTNAPTGLDVLAYSVSAGGPVSLVGNTFPVSLGTGTTAGLTIIVDSTQFSSNINDTITIVADESQ